MSSCGCASPTPAPPAGVPIADPSCPCGLPEAFRSAERYAAEAMDGLARLWPYSEIYAGMFPESRRGSRRRAQGGEERPGWQQGGQSPGLDLDGSERPELPVPDELYPGLVGEVPPADTGCDGWTYLGMAAPLLDPLGAAVPGCPPEPWFGWWLSTTSPAILRTGRTQTRMYFNDGQLAGASGVGFPQFVTDTTGLVVKKFAVEYAGSQTSEIGAWWRGVLRDANSLVTDLCFSRDFISFLDSVDGVHFPIYTPRVVSNHPTLPCFYQDSTHGYSATFESTGFRAGWRSTIIPCRREGSGGGMIYHADSVIQITVDRRPMYLLFAVKCGGHFQLEGATYRSDDPCNPCNACQTEGSGFVPVTNYVLFFCRDPDFQYEVYGPYSLVSGAETPDPTLSEWIGVPTAFMSPDGRFLFFYIPPQPTVVGGMRCAGLHATSVEDLDRVLTQLLATRPPSFGPSPLTDQDAARAAATDGGELAAAFLHLSWPLDACDVNETFRAHYVDQQFIFCDDRLHLFATHVTNPGGADARLSAVLHASAVERYDADALARYLRHLSTKVPFSNGDDVRVEAMLLRFKRGACHPITADSLIAEGASLNDPTVYPLWSWDQAHAREPMMMLFYSMALGGLAIAGSMDAYSLGECFLVDSIPDRVEFPAFNLLGSEAS